MKTLIYQVERWSISVVLLSLLLTFAHCTSEIKLLKATFESDVIGQLPNKTLPGDPAGDEITYVSGIESQLEVVNGSSNSTKALLYRGSQVTGNPPETNRWLGFKGKSSNFQKPVKYQWVARSNFTVPGASLYIDISGGSSTFARIIIEYDQTQNQNNAIFIKVVKNLATNESQLLGSFGVNEVHTITLSVNLATGKYHISVITPNKTFPTNNEFDLLGNLLPATPRAHISFKYSDYISSYHYPIDGLYIDQQK